MTLEDLLRMKVLGESPVSGKQVEYTPDFRVSVQQEIDGGIHFIIHASGHNSETLDLVVNGNNIRPAFCG